MQDFKLSEKSNLKYIQDFFKLSKEDYLWLIKQCPENRHEIKIYGKKVKIPRYQQAYGKSYAYSGTVSEAKEMPELIKNIRNKIQKLYPKLDFNNCLINWYLTGDDYISFHSDDESNFVENTPIVGITFCDGTPRKLQIKDKQTYKMVKEVRTYNGSCYIMEGNFQKEFTHGIPKQKNVGKRISLTFRCFKK